MKSVHFIFDYYQNADKRRRGAGFITSLLDYRLSCVVPPKIAIAKMYGGEFQNRLCTRFFVLFTYSHNFRRFSRTLFEKSSEMLLFAPFNL